MQSFNYELDPRAQIKYAYKQSRIFENNEYVAFIYTLSEVGQKIVDKVNKGAYSELPKWYKEEYFQETMIIKDRFDLAKKHLVVYKSSILKKMIEFDLAVKIDDRTELESKPILQEEILDHPYEILPEEVEIKERSKEVLHYIQRLRQMPIHEKFAELYALEKELNKRINESTEKRKNKDNPKINENEPV